MNSARLAAIRLKVMQGGYSSEAVAQKIVKVAEKPLTFRLHEVRKRYLLKRLGIAI